VIYLIYMINMIKRKNQINHINQINHSSDIFLSWKIEIIFISLINILYFFKTSKGFKN
jgi:hypothetical protein